MANSSLTGRVRRRVIAGVGVTGLSLVSSLLTAAPGHASVKPLTVGECNSCSCSHQNLDGRTGYLTATAVVRGGPEGACSYVSNEQNHPYMVYYCYVVNKYGNTWTYGRVSSGGGYIYGWVWDGHLSGDGSNKPCNE